MKMVDLGEPTSFLDHEYLGCSQRECKPNETILDECRKYSNHEFLLEQLKNCLGGRNHTQKLFCGLSTWKVMRRNAWKDIANLRRKRLNNFSKLQPHALMTINSKRKNWNLLEDCRKYALKSS